MGDSTRSRLNSHQASAAKAASLVAFLLGFGSAIASTNNNDQNNSVLATPLTPTAATTAIASVNAGEESLELSSRFAQDGNIYVEGVDWTLKTQSGEVIYHSLATTTDIKVQPGSYEVIVSYGTVKIDEAVNVPPETKLSINFVLNAGALRVLPRLSGLNGEQIASVAKIFALNGTQSGKLIASSSQPGQVIKLSAGSYRIKTQFADSNVVAITDVDVKPGIMRSLDVAHHAGLAHFSLLHAAENIEWCVMPDQGDELSISNPIDPTAVLKPGHYTAQAKIGDKILKQPFTVEDGKVLDVVLEN